MRYFTGWWLIKNNSETHDTVAFGRLDDGFVETIVTLKKDNK